LEKQKACCAASGITGLLLFSSARLRSYYEKQVNYRASLTNYIEAKDYRYTLFVTRYPEKLLTV